MKPNGSSLRLMTYQGCVRPSNRRIGSGASIPPNIPLNHDDVGVATAVNIA